MTNEKFMANAMHQLEYNVNLKRRMVFLEGELDTYSIPFFLERVHAIRDYHTETWTPGDNKEPEINLFITSPGGGVNALTGLVDLIQGLPCTVNTIGIGHVESAAVWVLASGTGKRIIAPNTEIMVHEMSSWVRGTTSDIENDAKHVIATQKLLYNLLGDITTKDAQFWETTLKGNKNLYLTPEQCIEYGIADEIIKPTSL